MTDNAKSCLIALLKEELLTYMLRRQSQRDLNLIEVKKEVIGKLRSWTVQRMKQR